MGQAGCLPSLFLPHNILKVGLHVTTIIIASKLVWIISADISYGCLEIFIKCNKVKSLTTTQDNISISQYGQLIFTKSVHKKFQHVTEIQYLQECVSVCVCVSHSADLSNISPKMNFEINFGNYFKVNRGRNLITKLLT